MLPPNEKPDHTQDEEYDWYECETIEVIGANNTDDVLRKGINIENILNTER